MYDFTKINNGDILGVKGNDFIDKAICFVQSFGGLKDYAEYTHCSVAYWSGGILYSVEMDGTDNVLRPITQHLNSGRTVAVFQCPLPYDDMIAQFPKAVTSTINYDYLDFISIFYRLIFGVNIFSEPPTDAVCSSFVARWLVWAGWIPRSSFPKIPCPAEVCKALGTPKQIIIPENY